MGSRPEPGLLRAVLKPNLRGETCMLQLGRRQFLSFVLMGWVVFQVLGLALAAARTELQPSRQQHGAEPASPQPLPSWCLQSPGPCIT